MTGRRRLRIHGIAVKLVVPDNVEEIAVVDFREGRAHRIGGRVSDAPSALLELVVGAAGVRELLAKVSIRLDVSAERTGPLRAAATGERGRIKLENEPPIHRPPCF